MTCICGIDPGNDGGLAFVRCLSSGGHGWSTYRMPVKKMRGRNVLDLDEIRDMMRHERATHVVLEEAGSWGAQSLMSKPSIFTFAREYGRILGYLETGKRHLIKVRPEVWKRGFPFGASADKMAVIQYVRNAWPGIDLIASERGKKPHDGIADAVCIAWYGVRHFNIGVRYEQAMGTRQGD